MPVHTLARYGCGHTTEGRTPLCDGVRPSDLRDQARFQATDSSTLMLPRVAFEYGHTWCAFSMSACAVAVSTFGMEALIATSRPKPPASVLPMDTDAVTVEPEMSAFSRRATTPTDGLAGAGKLAG